MYQDTIVLCGSSAYEQKYYLNEDFSGLPQTIKDELKIMCVLFTEDVGGILTLMFEEDGTLMFRIRKRVLFIYAVKVLKGCGKTFLKVFLRKKTKK